MQLSYIFFDHFLNSWGYPCSHSILFVHVELVGSVCKVTSEVTGKGLLEHVFAYLQFEQYISRIYLYINQLII